MSLVVENESGLPVTVTPKDMIAVGTGEGTIPSLDAFAAIQEKQETFCRAIDWSGAGQDSQRVVESPRVGTAIVVVIHRIPRFEVCTSDELTEPWKGVVPLTRVTTLTFREGDMDSVIEDTDGTGLPDWKRRQPWCGQTVFTFDILQTMGPEAAEKYLAEKFFLPRTISSAAELQNPQDCAVAQVDDVELGDDASTHMSMPELLPVPRDPPDQTIRFGSVEVPRGWPERLAVKEQMHAAYEAERQYFDETEMMFQVTETRGDPSLGNPAEQVCSVCCARPSVTQCECCPDEVGVCGACCLLRHAEGRYQVQEPEKAEYVPTSSALDHETVVCNWCFETMPKSNALHCSMCGWFHAVHYRQHMKTLASRSA